VRAGKVVNIATATAIDPEEEEIVAEPGRTEDSTTIPSRPIPDPEPEPEEPVVTNPHLTIDKVATSKPLDANGYAEGETVTYKITVENDGDVALENITVTDDLTGDEWTIDSLAPGESKEFEVSYTVTRSDVIRGKVVNTATATGTDENGGDPEVTPGTSEVPTVITEEPVPGPAKAWALLNLICTILTGILSLVMLFKAFGKKKEEVEEEETEGEEVTRTADGEEEGEEPDEAKIKRHKIMRFSSILPTVAAIVTFILTEDMTAPMALVDRWTILMAVYLVVNVLLAVFSRKKKEDPEEEAEETAEDNQ